MGKFLAIVIVACALVAGGALYYLQVYAYYDTVAPRGADDVVLTDSASGQVMPIPHQDFRAIDSQSSPIRYRACFTTSLSGDALAAFQSLTGAEPRVAPKWFDCFDAREIGESLENGSASAYLSIKDVHYGIDRIVAILPDGRGFAWHEINDCGEVVFDGQPVPEGCPQPPNP